MEINTTCSPKIKEYFSNLQQEVSKAYKVAQTARAKGYDPEDHVDISLAISVSQRVEALIGSITPQILNKGIPQRINQLEKQYRPGDWRVSLKIADEIANEKFCSFDDPIKAISTGIRAGLAYVTQGVVSAPLEGIVDVKLKKRRDGKNYLAVYYAGPIRGAGGTCQSVSILIADYLRRQKNIMPYDPTKDEIKRFYTEVIDYYERLERKQYKPTEKEIEFLINHIPIEINGDPTSELEVSNYKNLPRVETNQIRSGVCLLLTDGIPLKAEKLWKQLKTWGVDFGLEEWEWLEEFIKLKKKRTISTSSEEPEGEGANYYFLSEIVAGRPVFSYPARPGGFRIRYGRSRLTGDGSWGISPLTMLVLKKYLATGTQLRVERPGKSTALTPCDSIEGPIVQLKDNSVVKIQTEEQAQQLKNKIDKILFLGDILISYGDFAEQGAKLTPAGYCQEWWVQELKQAAQKKGLNSDQQLANFLSLPLDLISTVLKEPIKTKLPASAAITISQKLNIPLHPDWTYHWRDISAEQFLNLYESIKNIKENTINVDENSKRALELIGCPHTIKEGRVFLNKDDSDVLSFLVTTKTPEGKDGLESIQSIAPVKIRDKSGITIGARMGRPEKAKIRKLKGTPHILFPVGREGGRLRSFQEAIEQKKVMSDFPIRECPKCNKTTIYPRCEVCSSKTIQWRVCPICKKRTRKKKCHTKTMTYENQRIDIQHYIQAAKSKLKIRQLPTLIKGVRGTSNKDHIPENLAKGILRAQHHLYVNKDGTIRFDMTELGCTHFKPKEIGLSVNKAKEIGYTHDIEGKVLESAEQIVEIRPQDVILPLSSLNSEGAAKTLVQISKFVDEELKKLYDLEPYYNLKTPKDLIGHLVIGLAPHTSAGILGRIIGFSSTQAIFAHPYWHDAQRRDLDGEETSIILIMDAFLNFSRQYLPNKRGARSMDAPLVLSTILNPEEIDDEVYDVDTARTYPLEFYEAAQNYKMPVDIKIEQIRDRVGKVEQYEGLGYTHEVSDLNAGVHSSAYKTIPTMLEKLAGQMELAESIRAVDFESVASLVIEGHFIKDIKGNLRKFTKQSFRCVKCNARYRRPPLSGACTECGGRLIFTIAEGTVKKYLELSLKLAQYGQVPAYLKQSLQIIQRRVESIFGKEKTKQTDLNGFFKK